MAVCTCAACGKSFSGLKTFDRHHEADYSRRPAVRCLDPATVGLMQQASGRWGLPADAASRVRLAILRAERARARNPGRTPP